MAVRGAHSSRRLRRAHRASHGPRWTRTGRPPPWAPSQGAAYAFGQTVKASYTCSDPTPGRPSPPARVSRQQAQHEPEDSGHGIESDHERARAQRDPHVHGDGDEYRGVHEHVVCDVHHLASPPVLGDKTRDGDIGRIGHSAVHLLGHVSGHTCAPRRSSLRPAHGTAVIQPTGKITYTNNNSAHATDSFQCRGERHGRQSVERREQCTINVQNHNPADHHSGHAAGDRLGLLRPQGGLNATYTCGDTVELISCTADRRQ